MKKKQILWLMICLLLVPLLFLSVAHADVGNSFSGNDGGGFSGGGSFDGSGFGSFIFLGGGSPFGSIITIIVIIIFIYLRHQQGTNGNTTRGYAESHPYTNPSRICNEAEAIRKIQQVDPDFSADQFKTYASEVWLTLQEAWEAKQWQGVRPLESNALFNLHHRQIQEYIDHNKTDHMDCQNVRDVTLAQFKEDGAYEVLVVKLYASLLNYVSDDTTGKIIEGSDKNYVHRTYCLEFIRSKGVKTEVGKEMGLTNCPNCGAPTQVTSSGECEYCHSVITNGNYGWVLNKYSAW